VPWPYIIAGYLLAWIIIARIIARELLKDEHTNGGKNACIAWAFLFFGPIWPFMLGYSACAHLIEHAEILFVARTPRHERKEKQLEESKKKTERLERELGIR